MLAGFVIVASSLEKSNWQGGTSWRYTLVLAGSVQNVRMCSVGPIRGTSVIGMERLKW